MTASIHTLPTAPRSLGDILGPMLGPQSVPQERELHPNCRHALALAQKGYRVFPLPVDEPAKDAKELKRPFLKNWPQLATTDEKTIRKWWSEANYNIGLATGGGVVAIDYDCKPGQKGAEALAAHEAAGVPPTMRVRTPTGGQHAFFRIASDLGNSAGKVAQNVDVRGDGGYVVAPGSTIHGKPYAIIRDASGARNIPKASALPELPDWLWAKATATRTKSSVDAKEVLVVLDTAPAIARAREWLENEAPEAVEGAGGNSTTYKVACKVRDFGVSKAMALELMLEHWNETKAAPPWPMDELERVVENAYQYATLPAGIANPAAEFEPVGLSEIETRVSDKADKPTRPKLSYVKYDDGAARALETMGDPLIKGLLNAGGLSAMYGRSNSGKTFMALDMAYHIAAGLPWQGRKVKQGLVIYVAAEGGRGIFKRVAALKKTHGGEGVPLAIVPCPVDLLRDGKESDTAKLIELVQQAEKDYGQKAVLIVIDTLSRALAGGDENSSQDMGTFVKHVDRIRAATGSHLMIVHHSGKDQAKGMRGWSGMQAALDTEIEIREHTIRVTKQRDLEPIKPLKFELANVSIGVDADGEAVTSCVVSIRLETEFDVDMTDSERKLLDLLKGMAANKINADLDPDTTIHDIVLDAGTIQSEKSVVTGGLKPDYVRKLLRALVNKGCLENPMKGQYLISASE